MSEIRNFDIFFYNDLIVCPDCMKNFKVHKQTYRIKETFMYVLYEYDEFLERLFFQYKDKGDFSTNLSFFGLFITFRRLR